MILVDKTGHMVSDASIAELDKFAGCIGLRKTWRQISNSGIVHYDLTTPKMIVTALFAKPSHCNPGVEAVSNRELWERAVKPGPEEDGE